VFKPLFLFLMLLLSKLLRLAFYILYHPLAWAYDWVADLVSLGQWKEWIREIIPYVEGGGRILELGHGPGHLQRFLLDRGLFPFGVDESTPMGRLARGNLQNAGYTRSRLARGLAQFLPFPADTFTTVVATFPAEYIFDPRTLSEVRRVLLKNGKLVILLSAWPNKHSLPGHFFAWLFRVTAQSAQPSQGLESQLRQTFEQAGWIIEVEFLKRSNSHLIILHAQNSK